MLSDKLLQSLNEQVNAELYSSYLYASMSAHFESVSFRGIARWLRLQAQEELAHAVKFFDHVHSRGGRVRLAAIAAPPAEWSTPLAAFEAVLEHERHVTELIGRLMDRALGDKDHATAVFLQWFVTEQVEEEQTAEEIVHQVRMVEHAPGGLYMLDRELGRRGAPPSGAE